MIEIKKKLESAHLGVEPCGFSSQLLNAKHWTQSQPIRTVSQIPIRIKITLNQTIPLYQKLAPKIKELKALGMTYEEISKSMNLNKKTVGKGLHCCQQDTES